MDKYRLYIKETSSEWSHSGYCSNPNTSYKTCEYKDEKTMMRVPSINFIDNYSNEFGDINDAGKEIICPVYNSCCGTRSSCTDAHLIKIVDGCWLNCFADTFIKDPDVIAGEAQREEKKRLRKQKEAADRLAYEKTLLEKNEKATRNYYSKTVRRTNIPCKFGSTCIRNKNGTCLYKH